MVSAVLAADAFAGEKERRTLETLLHLPVADRDLYIGQAAGVASCPRAGGVVGRVRAASPSWPTSSAWPVMHRLFLPTRLWMVVILWIAPAVAAVGLGSWCGCRSGRTTTQEASSSAAPSSCRSSSSPSARPPACCSAAPRSPSIVGAVVWAIALWLIARGAKRFSRDRLSV